ncbi:MAPEG family protein [Ramlibacter humi]|uniref:MAPEG family protein n=1 Tax=Ramlibacter humi TaxID=2530451 RepID=A0A4Z0BNR1_9BURK|nr:MAPEG family protein [Ramlibacter humi]TFZ00060.1 MAPEG family protein [Ramlibacter humi]
MTASAIALIVFIAWTLALLVAMEAMRSWLVLAGRMPSNRFTPDNANLSPLMQRLARAHANCIEGLPVFGGLLLVATVSGRHELTDPLAPWLVVARVLQSSVHVASTSVPAVNVRFTFFCIQVVIAIAWVGRLLAASVAG